DVSGYVVAADNVDDDVGAAPGKGFEDGEVLGPVIEAAAGAESLAGPAFGVAAGGCVDGGAQRPGQLDGEGADTARAAVDQHDIASSQSAPFHQVEPHSEGGFGQGRRCLERHALGHGQAQVLVGEGAAGIAAACQ